MEAITDTTALGSPINVGASLVFRIGAVQDIPQIADIPQVLSAAGASNSINPKAFLRITRRSPKLLA